MEPEPSLARFQYPSLGAGLSQLSLIHPHRFLKICFNVIGRITALHGCLLWAR